MKMKITIKSLVTAISIITFLFSNAQAQMFWNQAESINASANSYIAYPNSASLNITGSFTIEAWVNRSSAGAGLLGIVSKSKTLFRYGLTVQNTGRIQIAANNSNRLISRSSTAIQPNTWTHIAGTFNSTTFTFKIYINGVLDTTCITTAASVPLSNTDSLYIGNAGIITPFSGQVDEVRIWNRDLSNSEISLNRFTSLGATGGIYNGLVLSTTFQGASSLGILKGSTDMSGLNNVGFKSNVGIVNLKDNPSGTIGQNECLQLDGNDDYVAGPDSAAVSPTNAITLECWVNPNILTTCRFISKGSAASPNFALTMGSVISAVINGTTITGAGTPTLRQWTHIAFTYSGSSGKFVFYKNGIIVDSGISALGNITNGTDSIYIGGGPGSIIDLNGFLDEVRIANYVKSQDEINQFMYISIDEWNNPASAGNTNVTYNFDGLALDNAIAGGPRVYFRNNAMFSRSSAVANQPVTPINRADIQYLSQGFHMKTSNKRIPASGGTGSIVDSITVNLNQTMGDVELFVAINHQNSANLEITLVAPNGDSVKVFDNNTTSSNSNNIVTVFDDDADSSLINGRYVTFSNVIKPASNMISRFGGNRSKGKWKIRINDVAGADTGIVYAWGVHINYQFNRDRNLNMAAFVQGFFNPATGLMIPDTLKVTLRNSVSPFAKIDSASAILDNTGNALLSFNGNTIQDNVNYYIQVNHRNSIETWSAAPQHFSFSELNFNFRNTIGNAFGGNMIFVSGTPISFAFFSGDENQNGVIDLTDIINISNDAAVFTTGYKSSDMNGDNLTDLNDVLFAFNNSNNFVSMKRP